MSEGQPTRGIKVRGLLVRRNWPLIVVVLALVAGLTLAGIWDHRGGYIAAASIAGAFGFLGTLRNAFSKTTLTSVIVTDVALTVEGDAPIALETITDVRRLAVGRSVVVRLEVTDRPSPLTLRFFPSDGDAVIAAIGPRRATFPLIPRLRTRVVPVALFLLAWLTVRVSHAPPHFFRDDSWWLLAGALIAVATTVIAVMLGFILRGHLVVGVDGFTVRWFGRERFVRYGDVTELHEARRVSDGAPRALRVALRPPRWSVHLVSADASNVAEERGSEGRAMLRALRVAIATARERAASVALASVVERQGRSPREWLAGVDAALLGGYRVAALKAETLESVVANPAAPRDARVGAAAALLRVDADEARSKLQVAAQGCAESELRDALHALAEAEDDEAVTSALARVAR